MSIIVVLSSGRFQSSPTLFLSWLPPFLLPLTLVLFLLIINVWWLETNKLHSIHIIYYIKYHYISYVIYLYYMSVK